MEATEYEYVLDHFKHPRNYGTIDDPDTTCEEGIPSCGDLIRLDINIADGRVDEVKFSGKGCAVSQAAASILTEMVLDKKVDECRMMTDEEMLESLGAKVSPIRFKCALLALHVLRKALNKIADASSK